MKNTILFPAPEAISIRAAPRIGPVQEKETKTVVKAMKKATIYPPLSAPLSLLFIHEEGKVISNNPKNEKANAINIRKKIRLGIQCVEITYMASLPNKSVRTKPRTANMNIIEKPKKYASLNPCFLVLFPFMKKEIVIGIIGKTQGVISVSNPAPKEIRKTIHIGLSLPSISVVEVIVDC